MKPLQESNRERALIAFRYIGLHGVEDFPRQFLRDPLADRSALHENNAGLGLNSDIPSISRDALWSVVERRQSTCVRWRPAA